MKNPENNNIYHNGIKADEGNEGQQSNNTFTAGKLTRIGYFY